MTDKHVPCIVVGITGGIAAYKTCSLVSSLKKKGYEVHVLMSKSAESFVTPLTLQTLSGQRVITDMFSVDYEPDVHHISLAKKADLFVVAPATANFIAKVSCGIADDMLTTTWLAATCPKLIVPAMNTQMLENPITQENLKKCESYGMHLMQSGSGYLACGDTGKGRMPEPDEIEDAIEAYLNPNPYLKGKTVLITAGPTCEAIDPVRYITNHSSGKMGYALARAARNAGANVILVAGKNHLKTVYGVTTIPVTSAEEMYQNVMNYSASADICILSAAVADYRPKNVSDQKMHKSDSDLSIELERTRDILATLGEQKHSGQILIGFAMETENLIASAESKLKKKNCDYIVANNLKEEGAGFEKDTNKVTILSKEGNIPLEVCSKDETAEQILRVCILKEKKEDATSN